MRDILAAFGLGFLGGVIVYDVVQGEIAVWRAKRWLKRYDRDNRDWYDL